MDKKYEFRELCSADIFPMFKLLKKIGVREFKDCFQNVKNAGKDVEAVGMSVVFDIAGIIVANLPSCENEIYGILASVSNLDEKEIRSMKIDAFAEMIIDFVKKPEFQDFFKVVSRLFKSET